MQRWYGEYPSMYLSTAGLIHQVQAHVRIRPTGRLTPRKQAALAVTGLAEPLTGHVGWDGTASRPGLQLADSCGGQIKT